MKQNIIAAGILLFSPLPLLAEQTCFNTINETTPTADFTINGDGTVTHLTTGLMWMRCRLRTTWDGTTCNGFAADYLWEDLLPDIDSFEFAGHTDWRLPNIKELLTLVEESCYLPALNMTIFPTGANDQSNGNFWSSTQNPAVTDSVSFLGTDFTNGHLTSQTEKVRLVR